MNRCGLVDHEVFEGCPFKISEDLSFWAAGDSWWYYFRVQIFMKVSSRKPNGVEGICHERLYGRRCEWNGMKVYVFRLDAGSYQVLF